MGQLLGCGSGVFIWFSRLFSIYKKIFDFYLLSHWEICGELLDRPNGAGCLLFCAVYFRPAGLPACSKSPVSHLAVGTGHCIWPVYVGSGNRTRSSGLLHNAFTY